MRNRKYLLTILSVILVLLGGCASKIMESYIGKDVRTVVLRYGPPANAIDLGRGKRAFQWIMNSSYTTPTYVSTTSYGSAYGSRYNATAWVNSYSTITGGQTINSRCIYTLITKWDKSRNAWIVTGYQQPGIGCE